MIKYRKNCAVCGAIKKKHSLADEIYQTTYYDKTSAISLREFAENQPFSYDSLRNHVKKHQGITAEDLSERHLQTIVKKAEQNVLKKNVESKDVWQTILDTGSQQLADGSIKINAGHLLRAAKDKSDHDLKAKDQEMAMIEMLYHFASGENNNERQIDAKPDRDFIEAEAVEHFDTTQEPTGSSDQGEDGPSGVYYPPTWDAAT